MHRILTPAAGPKTCYDRAVALDERAFFHERPEQRPGKYTCPRCRRTNEYSIRWVRRTKKPHPPSGDADRARYAKLRDHLLRLDDEVVCKTCGKKFEIPSHHSLLFVDQLEGLPRDEDLDAEIAAADGASAPPTDRSKLPARFTRPSKGWRG
jgi:transcription elongation factor Elf1